MKQYEITKLIMGSFPYDPTADQNQLIAELSAFMTDNKPNSLFILKGYAGTGKTTVISSLVRVLPQTGRSSVLLAPTGRAAKVLSSYSDAPAYTIHKKIYRLQNSKEGNPVLVNQKNKHRDTVFIVDEASMIPLLNSGGSSGLFGEVNLLDDLISYVYNGNNCRMILLGDTAQLPPVMSPGSPALKRKLIESRYNLSVREYELRDVVRQSRESGILLNATRLRQMLNMGECGFPKIQTGGFPDVIRVSGQEAAEEVDSAYLDQGVEQSLMICRTNKRATLFNKHIRHRVLFMEGEINAGDLLMVVKNNYFWINGTEGPEFIANGDIIELKRIIKTEEQYGFRFADAIFRLTDYPDAGDLEAKLLLDTLDSDGSSLSSGRLADLYGSVSADYSDIPNKRERNKMIRSDKYLNALQVKFAYAMTCHKAQGGQWQNVFVEMGFIPGKIPDTEYLRWLYTAVTRAQKKLFLLNFSDDFFPE